MSTGLAASELLLRRFRPQDTLARLEMNNPAMYRPSDLLPYELRPGYAGRLTKREFDVAIRIDREGYRSPEFAPAAKKRVRVLVAGDSFTFGWGVEAEAAYPQRLERLLARRLGDDVEVINAGFAAGYYPDTYYLYLKERGLALGPDVVVVGVFIGNDLDHSRALENEWTAVDAEGLPRRIVNVDSKVDAGWWVARRRPRRYDVPLLRNSHLFQLAATTGARLLGGNGGSPEAKTAAPALAAGAGADGGDVPPVYRVAYTERTRGIVAKVERLFRAIKRLTDERRVPLVVLLIPDRMQLVPAERVRTATADWDKPQRILGEFFATEGIRTVDLLADVRARAASEALYFPMDSHWNAKGHELAARRLADFLLEGSLVRAR